MAVVLGCWFGLRCDVLRCCAVVVLLLLLLLCCCVVLVLCLVDCLLMLAATHTHTYTHTCSLFSFNFEGSCSVEDVDLFGVMVNQIGAELYINPPGIIDRNGDFINQGTLFPQKRVTINARFMLGDSSVLVFSLDPVQSEVDHISSPNPPTPIAGSIDIRSKSSFVPSNHQSLLIYFEFLFVCVCVCVCVCLCAFLFA